MAQDAKVGVAQYDPIAPVARALISGTFSSGGQAAEALAAGTASSGKSCMRAFREWLRLPN